MNRIGKIVRCVLAAGALAVAGGAAAPRDREQPVDKSVFNFFNPAPLDQLRLLTTDGPGATESPYTVDAGHFQIEMALVDYTSTKDTFEGVTSRQDWLAIAPFNLKVGLLNSLDLQLLLEPYNHAREREEGFSDVTRAGFGDTTVRLKFNLWGNDRGGTAGAVLPYLKIPTSQEGVGNDVVEGGGILPLAVELPWDFHLGLTARFRAAQDVLGGNGRHAEFGNSIELAHQLFGDLEGYVELFSNVSTEKDVGWVGTFDTGLVYWLTDDLQVNAGTNIGVTKWANDWNLFVGFAWRY
jgi:hypothetical protein